MKIVSAHQPAYLPWLGLLHKISMADLFVVFDCVSFEKGSFINRNRLLSPSGGWSWLTLPVSAAGEGALHTRQICTLLPDCSRNWRRKHLDHIRHAYSRCPGFKAVFPPVEEFFSRPYRSVADICVASTELLLGLFGITTPMIRSSALNLTGEKSDRVLNLAEETSADIFVFGTLGKNYADEKKFLRNGVFPYFQAFTHPEYDQGRRDGFISGLSALDFLFHNSGDPKLAFSGNAGPEDLIGEAMRSGFVPKAR